MMVILIQKSKSLTMKDTGLWFKVTSCKVMRCFYESSTSFSNGCFVVTEEQRLEQMRMEEALGKSQVAATSKAEKQKYTV